MCKCQEILVNAGENLCVGRDGGLKSTIPWCLAHTAKRNGNWKGALGRLHPSEPFPTIVTSLAPLKNNGKIIHPTHNRFLSVREVARAQTFPDTFQFDEDCRVAIMQVSNQTMVRIFCVCIFSFII
jgi:site-specific DNA-cytosine methylase